MQDKFEGKGNELIDIYYHAVYIKRVKMSQQFVKKSNVFELPVIIL
jgi:hypothetical protein